MNLRGPDTACRRAMVLLEACISIMLIGLLLTVVSLVLTRYARATDYFLNYRRAQLAAESCIERMRAGVLEVEDAVFIDDAGVNYDIQVGAAEGDWAPLRRVRVRAEATGRHGRKSGYELTAFVGVPSARGESDD